MPEGGRWASKHVPSIKDNDVGFSNDTLVGSPCGWTSRAIELWGAQTTFTRTVETGDDGTEVASVTTDCDDPSVLLLARKDDAGYWSGDTWAEHFDDRRLWSAEICRQMLEEGLVSTGRCGGTTGIREAMLNAGSPNRLDGHVWAHVLTGVVAQIRGLRLIQSAAPDQAQNTTFGGAQLPNRSRLFNDCFGTVLRVYRVLPQPPWYPTDAPTPWGPQPEAGHATDTDGYDMFVGEHGDLLWRALTETDRTGMSLLNSQLEEQRVVDRHACGDMVVAAALYDETAQRQLTHGLFDATIYRVQRHKLKSNVRKALDRSLDPLDGECRWTLEQQDRIREFINIVKALEP